MTSGLLEFPKVYLFAFIIAAIIHVFFMEKVSSFSISYMYEWPDGTSGYGNVGIASRGDDPPTLKGIRTFVENELMSGGDTPVRPKVVMLDMARMDYRWEWKWK